MGCADHRISSVCHPYRPGGYVLHGNVGKGKKRGASESDALFLINSYTHTRCILTKFYITKLSYQTIRQNLINSQN